MQKRTVADVRNTGVALVDWMTDIQTGSLSLPAQGHAGEEEGVVEDLSLAGFREVSYEEIFGYLHPGDHFFYMQEVPEFDGWKNRIEFYFLGEATPPSSILIRSAGCQGEFEEGDYRTGPFTSTDYQQDIVWADGRFVRWPSGSGRSEISKRRPGDEQQE
jgi:hypothetical protein